MRLFIENYINKISISDIKNFGIKNDVFLSDEDAQILNFYLKNNWEELLYGNPLPIIREIREKFDSYTSEKILSLFNFYYKKYKNYL